MILKNTLIATIILIGSLPTGTAIAGESDLNRNVCKWDKNMSVSYKEFLRRHPACNPALGSLAYTGIQHGITTSVVTSLDERKPKDDDDEQVMVAAVVPTVSVTSLPTFVPPVALPSTPSVPSSINTVDTFNSLGTPAPTSVQTEPYSVDTAALGDTASVQSTLLVGQAYWDAALANNGPWTAVGGNGSGTTFFTNGTATLSVPDQYVP